MSKSNKKQNTLHSVLYVAVFGSLYTKYATSILFFVFLLQPLAPVFASEVEVPEADVESGAEVVAEEPVVHAEKVVEEPAETQDNLNGVEDSGELTDAEAGDVDGGDTDILIEEAVGRSDDEAVIESEEISTETGESSIESTDEQSTDSSTTTEDLPDEASENNTATTAPEFIDLPDSSSGETSSNSNSEETASSTETEVLEGSQTGLDVNNATSTEESANDSSAASPVTDENVESTEEINEEETQNATSTEDALDANVRTESDIDEDFNESSTATSTDRTASTTEERASSTEQILIVTTESTVRNADNFYQFATTECVTVSDGSYYCSKKSSMASEVIEDALYADKDADGDYEIYFAKDGKITKVTNNIEDDLAPYYDGVSNTIVWHRLIRDRYQIVSYDIDTREEQILTSNTVNDMEPSREGDITVWQSWVENTWEIMLHDGSSTTQLTNNNENNIAPKIHGDYVMWHSTSEDGAKVLVLYELSTGESTTINDGEGGAIMNPRFVLVYETKFANGDTVTKGYDFDSKEIIPLHAQGGELPDNIPSSDGTGETRALIQNKSNIQRGGVVDIDDDSPMVPNNTSSTSTQQKATLTDDSLVSPEETTLDLSRATSTPDISEIVDVPQETSSSTDTVHIPDVIIMPIATSTEVVAE